MVGRRLIAGQLGNSSTVVAVVRPVVDLIGDWLETGSRLVGDWLGTGL